jgi:hypothetical protein
MNQTQIRPNLTLDATVNADFSLLAATPIDRLAYALALALTAPAGREADADALAQQYAAGLSPRQITEAQRHALALVTR